METRTQQQTGVLNALTPIVDNNNGWFKRTAQIDARPPLVTWHQTKSVLESLDKLVGKRVSFYVSDDGTKIRFANIRDNVVWPFESLINEDKSEKPMAREDYWRRKEEFDVEREKRFQQQHYENGRRHYENLIAPGIWKTVPEGATLDQIDAAIALIQEKAKALHGQGIS